MNGLSKHKVRKVSVYVRVHLCVYNKCDILPREYKFGGFQHDFLLSELEIKPF